MQPSNIRTAIIAGILAVSLAGCGPQITKALKICPGKATTEEAITALGRQVKNLVPLRASGECTYVYDVNGRKHEERLNVQARIEPPADVYLQGGSIIGKVVELGANDREFWLELRPKEISTYLWGVWADEGVRACLSKLWIGPQTWLEAFGMTKAVSSADVSGTWELSHEGPFDILSRKSRSGILTKRVYIYCCDYLIRKIEYFDDAGNEAMVVELDDYVPVSGWHGQKRSVAMISSEWKVPRKINIKNSKNEMVDVELKNVAEGQFNDTQRKLWFNRPVPQGFDHIGRMTSACDFVEQNPK
jgi:hypothetical protein